MAAKFEIRQPTAGEFRWVLVSQGRTLATGPAYARRALAQKSIDSFRMAAIAAPVDDLTVATAKTPVAKVARVAGRAGGEAVVKAARTVKKAETAAAKAPTAAKRAATTVKNATTKAANAVKPAPAAKKAAGRKRTASK